MSLISLHRLPFFCQLQVEPAPGDAEKSLFVVRRRRLVFRAPAQPATPLPSNRLRAGVRRHAADVIAAAHDGDVIDADLDVDGRSGRAGG